MYGIAEGNQFIMVMPDKEVLLNDFLNVLYYPNLEDCYLVLVNAVEENREGLSHRVLAGAREARWALAMFGFPSQKTFEHMVLTIKNFPVIIEEVCNNNTIYGCNIPTLKGKNSTNNLSAPKHNRYRYQTVCSTVLEI